MHTELSADNPHGYNRYGFAWQHIPVGGAAHLDFGCQNGAFLASLKSKAIAHLVGVDISADAVRKAHQLFPDIEVIHICKTVPLPFDDGAFTSITILDVIEHLTEQSALLSELNRVLQDNGVLIVTVPGQHFFSFLDTGNFKFRFPRIHRWYYCRKHSKAEYELRYMSHPDGLIGDISARKRWHEHFARTQLEKLLNCCGFTVVDFDGAGFFVRLIKNAELLLGWIGPVKFFCKHLEILDARLFESANLFCLAQKKQPGV